MRRALEALVERLKEPSTWAAMCGLFVVGGSALPPDAAQHVAYVGSALAGVLGVALKENR